MSNDPPIELIKKLREELELHCNVMPPSAMEQIITEHYAAMGDASTRKDEGVHNGGSPTIGGSPSETSGVVDSEAELSLAISSGISLVAAGWNLDAAVKATIARIRPYLRATEPVRFNEKEHGYRYVIGERAIADCFPTSADPSGIYHIDSGNLQALVHTALEIHDQQRVIMPVMVDLDAGAKVLFESSFSGGWEHASEATKNRRRQIVAKIAEAWGLLYVD